MWDRIEAFIFAGERCLGQAWAAESCRGFWVISLFATLVALAIPAMLWFVVNRRRVRAMRRATNRLTLEHLEHQARVADALTMQRVKWKGDSFVSAELDEAQMTARIREALRSRKLNGGP